MTLGSRVRALRLARRLTQAELAGAVRKRGGDLAQSQLSAIERDEVDRPGSLVELARELETTEGYLLGKTDVARLEDLSALANMVPAPDAPLPPLRTDMPKDVPVYGSVLGGSTDSQFDFELNGSIIDYVRRPPRFMGRKDLFAAFVQGESMSPWREPGQLVYLEGAKPPRNLDYVLIELRPRPDGARPALIKRLIGVTPTKIKLLQYQPQREFDIERKAILRIYRVVELDEMFTV